MAAAPAGGQAHERGTEREGERDRGAGEELPASLRAAIAGGPLPEPVPGIAPPGLKLEVVPVAGGARDRTAGDQGGAGATDEARGPAEGDRGAAPPGAREIERRANWVRLQQRRNGLRVEVMTAEFHLSPEVAENLSQAFEGALWRKVDLYESLEARGAGTVELTTGLAEIRAQLERDLVAEIGREKYAAYKAMDDGGRFVLPEEKEHLPPK